MAVGIETFLQNDFGTQVLQMSKLYAQYVSKMVSDGGLKWSELCVAEI